MRNSGRVVDELKTGHTNADEATLRADADTLASCNRCHATTRCGRRFGKKGKFSTKILKGLPVVLIFLYDRPLNRAGTCLRENSARKPTRMVRLRFPALHRVNTTWSQRIQDMSMPTSTSTPTPYHLS